jgi:peptidoglycan/LPS O-acetylase OafA/YrhL
MIRKYIPTLDGWRAIAVLLVIGAHAIPMLKNSDTLWGKYLISLFIHAGLGVDIFFALSGYLICTMLLDEKKFYGSVNLASFYTRRAFRIIPPILAYLSVLFFMKLWSVIPSIGFFEMGSVILFFRNYISGGTWYTAHFWSLAVEEHFYFIMPLVFMLFSLRMSLKLTIILAFACAVIRWIEFNYGFFVGSNLEFRTENRWDALMYGALLAQLLHRDSIRIFLKNRLTFYTALVIVIIAAVLLINFTSLSARRTIVAVTLPILICYTVLHPEKWIGRFLESSGMRWIGKLSYSLYIWQMFFLVPGNRNFSFLQSFPWAFFCIAACALVSYKWIEKPMIAIGHHAAARFFLDANHVPKKIVS